MGRLLSFILGGAALALYVPHLFMSQQGLEDYKSWWVNDLGIGTDWYQKIFDFGPGIFAGLCLILLAIRGKD